MDLKLPIVVEEHGDVGIYMSVEDAEAALEPIDVRNGEYRFFDATGLALRGDVQAVTRSATRRRLFFPRLEHVQLAVPEDHDRRPEELIEILRSYLSRVGPHRVGIDESELRGLTLSGLIHVTARFLSG